MSMKKGMVGALVALLGVSAFSGQSTYASGAAVDGRIVLADAASDRARAEAQRREEQRREDQRREQEQRREEQRREQERRRQEEQRQRAEERRREEAAAEQKRRDEAAEQKRKDEAAEKAAEKKRRDEAAEQKRREEQAAEQRRRDEQASEQRRREAEQRAAEQKRAASVQQSGAIAERNKPSLNAPASIQAPHNSAPQQQSARPEQKSSTAPIHNGTIPDRNRQGLTPNGSIPAPQASVPSSAGEVQRGYADRQYAGPNGQLPQSRSSANPVQDSKLQNGHAGTVPIPGKASSNPNWGSATGAPLPLTTNRPATTPAVATNASGAAAGSSAPKTREEKAAADKAAKDSEKTKQQQAEQEYLQKVAAGIKLVATKCPDGEGNYYATGSMPKIKPEVVGCIDVNFEAYCPGSNIAIKGRADNFIGMSGCFGDTYDIKPKPACSVKEVAIRVVNVVPGCNSKK